MCFSLIWLLVFLVAIGLPQDCFCQPKAQPVDKLGRPQDIELDGAVRREQIISALGPVELRWPRSVEVLFGRTPQRALSDAMLTASRAMRQSGFPNQIRSLNIDWKVVFMDEDLPEAQIPKYLVDNCHPAWMTPPGNIYVVAQRVVAGCSGAAPIGSRVADEKLVQILLHEIGHAVEAQLLGPEFGGDRMLREGFASWFEQYSADYSGILSDGEVRKYYSMLAKQLLLQSEGVFNFSGSAADYALASQYYWVIVDKKGVYSLMQVYQRMRAARLDYFSAIDQQLYWNKQKVQDEMLRILR